MDLKKILEPLSGYLGDVEREILLRLRTGIPLIDSSAQHLFSSGGKRIRASLVILTSGLKNKIPDGIVPLAAAAEIVHAASLIHDDIIDQSLFRRGSVTVPQKWGNKVAVLAGDYMYSLALNIMLEDDNPAIYPLLVSGTKDMVMGELCQLQYADLESARQEHYLTIIELKTARFMGACAKLGATKAGMTAEDCDRLYSFGLNLGFAFQIIDDTLDILQRQDEIGKDAGSDFKDGKITLPFLRLIETGTGGDLSLLKKYMDRPEPRDWDSIKKRLTETGAMDYSVRAAGTYIDKAREIMMAFPDSRFRNILLELSDFLLNRKY